MAVASFVVQYSSRVAVCMESDGKKYNVKVESLHLVDGKGEVIYMCPFIMIATAFEPVPLAIVSSHKCRSRP